MALRGQGLAWLPRSLVANELAAGSLVLAGDDHWTIGFDVRLYRSDAPLPDAGERLWQYVSAENGQTASRQSAAPDA